MHISLPYLINFIYSNMRAHMWPYKLHQRKLPFFQGTEKFSTIYILLFFYNLVPESCFRISIVLNNLVPISTVLHPGFYFTKFNTIMPSHSSIQLILKARFCYEKQTFLITVVNEREYQGKGIDQIFNKIIDKNELN